MTQIQYPALYHAADESSNATQRKLLLAYKINAALLVAAAAVAVVTPLSVEVAIASALLFLASLATYWYVHGQKLQARWYRARALAESIKTMSWRLMMRAEPFDAAEERPRLAKFRERLSDALHQNEEHIGDLAGQWSDADQVAAQLLEVMRASLNERRSIYFRDRIDDQKSWYAAKAKYNKGQVKHYFVGICIAYAVAIIWLLIRVGYPDWGFLPVDAVAVIASSMIGWTQLKRFEELASAYSLAAVELGIIRGREAEIGTEEEFSEFVGESEAAFSREHTQWIARQSH